SSWPHMTRVTPSAFPARWYLSRPGRFLPSARHTSFFPATDLPHSTAIWARAGRSDKIASFMFQAGNVAPPHSTTDSRKPHAFERSSGVAPGSLSLAEDCGLVSGG